MKRLGFQKSKDNFLLVGLADQTKEDITLFEKFLYFIFGAPLCHRPQTLALVALGLGRPYKCLSDPPT